MKIHKAQVILNKYTAYVLLTYSSDVNLPLISSWSFDIKFQSMEFDE